MTPDTTQERQNNTTQLLLSVKQRTNNLSITEASFWESPIHKETHQAKIKEGWGLGSWPSTGAWGAKFLMWHLHTLSGTKGSQDDRGKISLQVFPCCRHRLWHEDQSRDHCRKSLCWIQELLPKPRNSALTSSLNLLKTLRFCVQEEWQVLPSASSHMKHLWVCIKMYELEFRETLGKQEPFPSLSASQEWSSWQVPSIVWAQKNVAEISPAQNANIVLGTAGSTASCWPPTHPLGSGMSVMLHPKLCRFLLPGWDKHSRQASSASLELQLLTAELTKSHFS